MSNITVITLNKFRKRARGLLRTRISSLCMVRQCHATFNLVSRYFRFLFHPYYGNGLGYYTLKCITSIFAML